MALPDEKAQTVHLAADDAIVKSPVTPIDSDGSAASDACTATPILEAAPSDLDAKPASEQDEPESDDLSVLTPEELEAQRKLVEEIKATSGKKIQNDMEEVFKLLNDGTKIMGFNYNHTSEKPLDRLLSKWFDYVRINRDVLFDYRLLHREFGKQQNPLSIDDNARDLEVILPNSAPMPPLPFDYFKYDKDRFREAVAEFEKTLPRDFRRSLRLGTKKRRSRRGKALSKTPPKPTAQPSEPTKGTAAADSNDTDTANCSSNAAESEKAGASEPFSDSTDITDIAGAICAHYFLPSLKEQLTPEEHIAQLYPNARDVGRFYLYQAMLNYCHRYFHSIHAVKYQKGIPSDPQMTFIATVNPHGHADLPKSPDLSPTDLRTALESVANIFPTLLWIKVSPLTAADHIKVIVQLHRTCKLSDDGGTGEEKGSVSEIVEDTQNDGAPVWFVADFELAEIKENEAPTLMTKYQFTTKKEFEKTSDYIALKTQKEKKRELAAQELAAQETEEVVAEKD